EPADGCDGPVVLGRRGGAAGSPAAAGTGENCHENAGPGGQLAAARPAVTAAPVAALSWYSRHSTTLPSRTRSTPMNGAFARWLPTVPPSSYSTTIVSGSAVSCTATVRHS